MRIILGCVSYSVLSLSFDQKSRKNKYFINNCQDSPSLVQCVLVLTGLMVYGPSQLTTWYHILAEFDLILEGSESWPLSVEMTYCSLDQAPPV